MTKLREVVGKLWRKSPEYPKHMTVYGYEILTKFVCVVCKEEGYLAEAYMKSVRDKKHGNDVRPYHADCYIATNGKYLPEKEVSTASLLQFLKD